MNPDVAEAVTELERTGVLAPSQAALFARVAQGRLVSVRQELRVLLYVGILLLTGGVGLLVKEHLAEIGPLTIALGIGAASLACLVFVARGAPPFTWGETPSRHLAADYMLLLGVLLAAADLAYVEAEFTPLGTSWPWHLLLVSVFTGVLAVRYDSRVVFSLALTTFAAWRGVSASLLERTLWSWSGQEGLVRANAIACGALFILVGSALGASGRKPHFRGVAAHLGWILVLAALMSGVVASGSEGSTWSLLLFLTGAALGAFAFRSREFSLFTLGVLGSYVGLSALVVRQVSDSRDAVVLVPGWFLMTAMLLLVGLLVAHKAMRSPA